MIETILQFNEQSYPFDSIQQCTNLKLEVLRECKDSNSFAISKRRFQTLKSLSSPYIIKLQQIFQEGLTMHLIYQNVPTSLAFYLRNYIENYNGQSIIFDKKQLLKNIANDLCSLTQFLSVAKIFTHLRYCNFGVLQSQQCKQNIKVKYYIGSYFQFSKHGKDDLREFYLSERKKILIQIERDLQMQRRSDYLPSFIIKGNNLIFTDDLSQTKTRRKRSESPERFDRSMQYDSYSHQKNYRIPHNPKNGKNNNFKPKKHKYSQNFDQKHKFDFEEEKTNKSFDQQQTFSVTQTKSMKIQVQHQKPTQKCRKNSYKLKITTFQEISIDKDLDDNFDFQTYRNSFTPNESQDNEQTKGKNSEQKSKDYKQKVKDAKLKAEVLLNKYLKAKNKSTFR